MAGVRRTWDKEYFEKRAKERSEQGGELETDGVASKAKKYIKEEFKSAEDGAAGPMGSQRAFIKSREVKVDLESKVGKTEIINPTNADSSRGAGFWCEVCTCLLKDSASYLDHINGKKHQRALGFSMRVERADVDSVKRRLEELKQKVVSNKARDAIPITQEGTFADYETKLSVQLAEQEARKKRKREEAQLARLKQNNQNEEEEDPEADEMAQMMGFGGFGSKKR